MLPKLSFADLRINVIDAETDTVLTTLTQNADLPLDLLEGRDLTFAVEFTDPTLAKDIKHVRLSFGDQVKVEGVQPYSLFGDIGTEDFLGGTDLETGDYGLKIEVFGIEGGKTVPMLTETVNFEVQETAPVGPNTDFVVQVIDTDTDEVLVTLDSGDDIPQGLIDGKNVTLSVEAADPAFAAEIGSIRMSMGDQVQIENVVPYALFGNVGDDFKDGAKLNGGDYTLKLEVFSGKGASGELLATKSTEFSVSGATNPNPDPDPDPDPGVDDGVYSGQNGRIVLEAENGERSGAWSEQTVDGQTAMLWNPAQSSYGSVPTGQELSFQFQTDEGGSYFIGLHSARDKSAMSNSELFESDGAPRTDTGNDAYVRITNLDTGETVLEPIKLFTGLGGSDKKLAWGKTFDEGGKKSPAKVDLDADTKYEIDIVGRSDGYVLDKITLNKGCVLQDADAEESPRGSGSDPDPNPSEAAENSVGTENEFNGVRLWVSNDISEVDDAASTPSLFLGARNIAMSDDNVTGSAEKMTFEGAFTDTVRNLATNFVDDVEAGANAAAARYDIDVYSPRTDIDIGGNAAQLKAAMTQSLDTAYANNEQVIVVAGGPTNFSAGVVSDWLDDGSVAEQAQKAVWALNGGFSQVTHGDTVKNNGQLDYARDPSRNFFNISDNGDPDFIQEEFETLYQKAVDIAEKGIGTVYTQAEFNEIEDGFIPDSFLISLEDQNSNKAVRGPEDVIDDTIADDLAREYAKRYDKGNDIDISDVGMLGLLLGDGTDTLDGADMTKFLTDEFMM